MHIIPGYGVFQMILALMFVIKNFIGISVKIPQGCSITCSDSSVGSLIMFGGYSEPLDEAHL
jgi:hypothetical protein